MIGFFQQPDSVSPKERKEKVLASRYLPREVSALQFSTKEVLDLWEGTWKNKSVDEISTAGYVIATHEAALWSLWTTDTFKDVRPSPTLEIGLTCIRA